MTDIKEAAELLIVSDQHAEANRLLGKLRERGLTVQALAAGSENELAGRLEQSREVIVCFENHTLPVRKVLQIVQQKGLDIPLIFIRDEESATGYADILRAGAVEVVESGDGVPFAVTRVLELGRLRRENRRLGVRLKELERRYQLLLDSATEPFAYLSEGMHLYCNRSYARLFGHDDADTVRNTPFLDLLADKSRDDARQLLGTPFDDRRQLTLRVQTRDGSEFNVDMAFTPVMHEERPCLQLTLHKTAANREYSRKLDKIRRQDLLTRLYRKDFFMEKVEGAIGNAINNDRFSVLLLVQVNEFLDIKSTIGISNANLVLGDIAAFLRKSIRKPFAAARLDDYEFGLLLHDESPAGGVELANFIKSRINNHITSTALPSLQLSCSIGIAAINAHALDAEDILAKARANIDTPVDTGNASYEFRIGDSFDHRIGDILGYLDTALREERFRLLFQPVVNIKGAHFNAYEVLLRMLDSDGNDIMPKTFLPLANLNNRGEEIDRMVAGRVLGLLRDPTADINASLVINVTHNSLVSQTFLPWLSEELRRTRVPGDRLIFQISEIDICGNFEPCAAFCRGLRELNLKTAVFHFGCAINPVAYLDAIRPQYVKLDTSLVRGISYSEQLQGNVRQMIRKLHDNGHEVVVTKVEDANVLPVLSDMGVDCVQGFYLRPPGRTLDYEFVQEQEITQNASQV